MIFIPGNVPALKNSKMIIGLGAKCPKCKCSPRRILISSKTVRTWKKVTEPYWQQNKQEFIKLISKLEPPYKIGFYFQRKSRHKFDYTNAIDTLQDEMVHQNWLEDDNATMIIPVALGFEHCKDNPGVVIKVMK